MHKVTVSLLLMVSVIAPSTADAKCFAFRGNDVRVCVDGDDNAARRRATEVCETVTGGACATTGYSGACRRNGTVRCYDAAGEERREVQSD